MNTLKFYLPYSKILCNINIQGQNGSYFSKEWLSMNLTTTNWT